MFLVLILSQKKKSLFYSLEIKHIQTDVLSYLIVPTMMETGESSFSFFFFFFLSLFLPILFGIRMALSFLSLKKLRNEC